LPCSFFVLRTWCASAVEADRAAQSNKGMKLTKLSAAWLLERTCRLMPAPAGSDAGTASQLIPGVGQTLEAGVVHAGGLGETPCGGQVADVDRGA